MGETALVGVEFNKSEKLVSALEASGVRVAAALWIQFPEYGDWRFVLASKDLDALDLGDAYMKVNRSLKDAGISVWQKPIIHIMKTTDPFIRALRKVFRKEKDVVGIRVGGQTWGDRFIEDGYAYKIA
jgi:hypothetical protein